MNQYFYTYFKTSTETSNRIEIPTSSFFRYPSIGAFLARTQRSHINNLLQLTIVMLFVEEQAVPRLPTSIWALITSTYVGTYLLERKNLTS